MSGKTSAQRMKDLRARRAAERAAAATRVDESPVSSSPTCSGDAYEDEVAWLRRRVERLEGLLWAALGVVPAAADLDPEIRHAPSRPVTRDGVTIVTDRHGSSPVTAVTPSRERTPDLLVSSLNPSEKEERGARARESDGTRDGSDVRHSSPVTEAVTRVTPGGLVTIVPTLPLPDERREEAIMLGLSPADVLDGWRIFVGDPKRVGKSFTELEIHGMWQRFATTFKRIEEKSPRARNGAAAPPHEERPRPEARRFVRDPAPKFTPPPPEDLLK